MNIDKGHQVKITPGFYKPHGGTKVEIDGVEIQQLVDIKFEHNVDSISTLAITIYPQSVEVDGVVSELIMRRERGDD